MLALFFASCDSKDTKDSETDTQETTVVGDATSGQSDVVDEVDAEKEAKYNEALELIADGYYEAAYEKFKEIGDYKDAEAQLKCFRYVPTMIISVTGDNSNTYEFFYNDKNLVTKKTQLVLSNSGAKEYSHNYTYDAKGNLIKSVYSTDLGESTLNYTYDSNGELIKTVNIDNVGGEHIYDYTYDANGNLTKKVYTTGIESTVYDYTYDSNGNLIKEEYTYNSGTGRPILDYAGTYDYTYDSNNKLIKEVFTSVRRGQSSIQHTIDYTYDSNGNLINEVSTNPVGVKEISDYTYDSTGNLIKEVCSSERRGQITINYTVDYTYDSNGNFIKGVRDGRSLEIRYKFVYIPYDLSDDEESKFDWRTYW